MDFSKCSEEEKVALADMMFTPLNSSADVRNWIHYFLDLEIPLEITDPDSTSSPLDAIWQIYKVFKENSGDQTPGAILMSCREGMKTVSVSLLEVLLLLHFQLDIAHAAATESQSNVGIQYISDFMMKIEPLVKSRGWENLTQNKRTIQFKTPEQKTPYIKILICTPKGMNSLHANVLFLDELDLADPTALKEGRNIVGYSKGIYGMTVYLSTRKYAFGNMNAALSNAQEMRYRVLQWNILDVTEACLPARHKPELPRADRYVAKNLPLVQLSVEEYNNLPPTEQPKYELIKQAFGGCAGCKLLPVCKMRLAQKPASAIGGFYKPIISVMQKFSENDPDTAEAQLMCWKPGSAGLVFPRFSQQPGKGNVLELSAAYNQVTGENRSNVSFDMLVNTLISLGIELYAGVDWGFTHDAVIILVAKMPNDEIWVLDCFASPGLEFSDMLDTACKMRDRYMRVNKWYCDQAMPSHIKSFNKNHMRSPAFTKDVVGGIEALRSKIVNASGKRMFKIIDTPNNKKVKDAIMKHRFLLDGQGNVTPKPDDEPGIADICDALRYIGQNLFPVKGPQKPTHVWTREAPLVHIDRSTPEGEQSYQVALKQAEKESEYGRQLQSEMHKLIRPDEAVVTTGKKGGFHFSF